MTRPEVRWEAGARPLFVAGKQSDPVERDERNRWRSGAWMTALLLLMLAVDAGNGRRGAAWTLMIGCPALAAVVLFVCFWRWRLQVRILSDEIHVRRFGRDIHVRFESIERVVILMTQQLGKEQPLVDRVVLLVDRHDRTRAKFSQRTWGREVVDEVPQRINRPVIRLGDRGISVTEVRERFPGSYAWSTAHPYQFTLALFGVGALALVILVAVL